MTIMTITDEQLSDSLLMTKDGPHTQNIETVHLTNLKHLSFCSMITMKKKKESHPEQDGASVIDVHTNASKTLILEGVSRGERNV